MNSDDRIDQITRASTPDPDAPPCEFCGGGLDHYPECSEWPANLEEASEDLTQKAVS